MVFFCADASPGERIAPAMSRAARPREVQMIVMLPPAPKMARARIARKPNRFRRSTEGLRVAFTCRYGIPMIRQPNR